MEILNGSVHILHETSRDQAVTNNTKNNHVVPKHAFMIAEGEEEEEKENVSKRSGLAFLGLCRLPEFFQKIFLKPAWVLVFLCWASATQGMVINGFVNVVVSTIEKRFGLLSAETGLIAGSYDIGSMISVIPITYFGGRIGTSKPKYISIGLFIMGCGSLMFALPHFVTDTYLKNDEVLSGNNTGAHPDLCSTTSGQSSFSSNSNLDQMGKSKALATALHLSNFKYFFIFGQVLHGIGAAPLITLGTTLLDESVGRISSPLYIGIFQTFFVVGPAIGYMAGGAFLNIYTDVDFGIEIKDLDSNSPLWVGAWWIGFMVAVFMSWSCALFISCFPAVISTEQIHSDREKDEVNFKDNFKGESILGYGKVKDIPKVIWKLLTNPTYMFINFAGASDGMTIAGLSTFLPKFIQFQYGYSAGFAAIMMGIIIVPAGGLGTFAGGYLTKRLKLNRSQVIKMYCYCQLITIPCSFALLFYCENENFAGVNVPFPNTTSGGNSIIHTDILSPEDLKMTCNEECFCDLTNFDPICDKSANIMYYSACTAGCKQSSSDNNLTQYRNCQCMGFDTSIGTLGSCEKSCTFLPGLLVVMFISIWFTFMSSMPNTVATLRAVEPIHRSLALGIESIILRLIGTIPGPIFFGFLIDRTCQLKQGNCIFYENFNMAVAFCAVVFTMKILAVISAAVALYFSNRSPIRDELDDLVETNNQTNDYGTNQ